MNFLKHIFHRPKLSTHRPGAGQFLSLLLLARRLSDLPADKTLGTKKTQKKPAILRFISDHRFKSAVLWPAMAGQATHHKFLSDDEITELSTRAYQLLGLHGLGGSRQTLAADLAQILSSEEISPALRSVHGATQYEALLSGLSISDNAATSPLIAYMDSTSGMTLRGWAVNTSTPDIRPTLNVFVNGTFAGQITTSLMRPELAARHGGDGFFGFEFRLRPAPDQIQYQWMPVRLEDAATGVTIVEDQVLLGHDSGLMLRLEHIGQRLDDLYRRGVSSDSKGLQNQQKQLSKLLPRINKFQFTPFEQYRAQYDLAAQSVQPASGDPKATPLASLIIGKDIPEDWSIEDLCAACADQPDDTLIMLCDSADQLVDQAVISLQRRSAQTETSAIQLFVANHMAGDQPILHSRFDPFSCAAVNAIGRAGVMRKSALTRIADRFPTLEGGQIAAIYLAIYLEYGPEAIANHHEPLFTTSQAFDGLGSGMDAHIRATNYVLATAGASWRVTAAVDRFAKAPAHIARIEPARSSDAMLSVIIPTRNALDLTRDCIDSLFATMDDPDKVEIILVDNQSDDPATLAWMDQLNTRENCRVLRHDAPFNWSEINNVAAAEARGQHLLFLNNDTVALHQGWDVITRNLLEIDSIGALGARLLYEDATLQHAGVVLYDVGVAKHEGVGETCNDGGYLLRTRHDHLCAAVTGAYLACRRQDFDALGGFNAQDLSVTFNDIDFCLRMRELGLGVLYTPQVTFNHLESKSRGYDYMDPKKRVRAETERNWMENRWRDELGVDPYYPPEMARQGDAFGLLKGLDMFSGAAHVSKLKG